MDIYLAAPWIDRDLMPDRAAKFERAGHDITWKWWTTQDIPENADRDLELRHQAYNDLHGVLDSACLVLFNTAKSEGKAFETGLAVAAEIPIVAIGKRGEVSVNVFHYLDDFTWTKDTESAIRILKIFEEEGFQPGDDSWAV